MRDVRLVAQSGPKPPSAMAPNPQNPPGHQSFVLDAAREVTASPMGFDNRFTHAQHLSNAGTGLQTQASNASSMASSGTPVGAAGGNTHDAKSSLEGSGGSLEINQVVAAKAAAKAAKEARKAAHMAEMEKKGVTAEPKKQLTRAERRAQQEAQKAAKVKKDDGSKDETKSKGLEKTEPNTAVAVVGGDPNETSGTNPTFNSAAASQSRQQQHKIQRQREALSMKQKNKPGGCVSDHFAHLRPFQGTGVSSGGDLSTRPRRTSTNVSTDNEHPAVALLARCYQDGSITGGRARCVALLHTLKKVVDSFDVPASETYAHALTAKVNAVVQILQNARPMSVSMGNAVKSLKTHLARMSEEQAAEGGGKKSEHNSTVSHLNDAESKRKTMAHLEYFEQEKVVKAGKSIVEHGCNEIVNGDVVLTFGQSHHTFEILKHSCARKTDFKVIVVDSKSSGGEGLRQLKKLTKCGINTSYTTLKGLDYVLRKGGVTKVLLGAAAVLANGAVVSRCGTSLVAAAANDASVPVLVAAETCKFHERVVLDAVAHNELGDPDIVVFGAEGMRDEAMREAFTASRSKTAGVQKTNDASEQKDPASVLPVLPGVGVAVASAAPLHQHQTHERLAVIHLKYDTTPAWCVNRVVCESGAVAPTDVPSFLR